MHFVVVVSGSGNDPRNYIVNDPGIRNGARTRLSNTLAIFRGLYPASMRLYRGSTTATIADSASLTSLPPRLSSPQPMADEAVTGAMALYRNDETNMVLELASQSSSGDITEMQIWTDQHARDGWQAFSEYASVPLADSYYVQFRDSAGNTSDEIKVDVPFVQDTVQSEGASVYLPLIVR
jgi:hypothetical protein